MDDYQVAQAHGALQKAGSEAENTYSLVGRLYASKSGWILLSVPNAVVRGLYDALGVVGIELPPGHNGKPFSAHISVMRPSEVASIGGIDMVSDRGHTFTYQLGPLKSVQPAGWPEMSLVYFVEIRSPQLSALRRSYGLPSLPQKNGEDLPFHLTVAVRRKNVLRDSDVSKTGGVEENLQPLSIEKGSDVFFEGSIKEGRIAAALSRMLEIVREEKQGRDSQEISRTVLEKLSTSDALPQSIQNSGASHMEKDALAMLWPKLSAVQKLRAARNRGLRKMAHVLEFLRGYGTKADRYDAGTHRRERQLRADELQMGYVERTAEKSSEQSTSHVQRGNKNSSGMGRGAEYASAYAVSTHTKRVECQEGPNDSGSKIAQDASLGELQKAKRLSDAKMYRHKHNLIRTLIKRQPDAWEIGQDRGMASVRNKRTGFRYHMPHKELPS